MTRALYHHDPVQLTFAATVCASQGQEVALDATAFYPAGGGQGADNGPTVVSDVALASALEGADYTLSGGILCIGANVIDSITLSPIVQHAITQWVSDVGALCGASSPFDWQACP